MLYVVLIPVALFFLETAGAWLVKVLCGAICTLAVTMFFKHKLRPQQISAHQATLTAVNKVHNALMQAYSNIRPMCKSLWEIFIHYASCYIDLPNNTDPIDPNNDRMNRPYVPPSHVEFLSADHVLGQLKVTNNVNSMLQLTCHQVPTFERWIKKGQTVPLPDGLKSPVTISVQGYPEGHDSPVKLVHSVDFHEVQCVCIDQVDGVIQMLACAG